MGVIKILMSFLTSVFIQLHKELEELRERNKALEEVAGQAEYFASLYQVLLENHSCIYFQVDSLQKDGCSYSLHKHKGKDCSKKLYRQ